MLTKDLQVADRRFAAPARLAKRLSAHLIVKMRGKIFGIRHGRFFDFLAGGRRLCVLERNANRVDQPALRGRGEQSLRTRFRGAAGFGQQMHHRLANPPQRGRLKIGMRGIVPARRFDQSEVALVNQIKQRHTKMTEALRVTNHHAQICLHKTAKRHLIAMLLNLSTEFLLVVVGQ